MDQEDQDQQNSKKEDGCGNKEGLVGDMGTHLLGLGPQKLGVGLPPINPPPPPRREGGDASGRPGSTTDEGGRTIG